MKVGRLRRSLGLAFALLLLAGAAGGERPTDSGAPPVAAPSPAAADAATRRLLKAAASGHLRAARAAIAGGARLDENGPEFAGPGRQTALVSAALRGHAELVRLLIEAGADPGIPEKDGFDVWHAAAFQGRVEVLRVLDALAVPGYGPAPGDGLSPLHRAAWGRTPRHVETVAYLIGPGGRACDVSAPDGRTPLDVAAQPEIRALLEGCLGRARGEAGAGAGGEASAGSASPGEEQARP